MHYRRTSPVIGHIISDGKYYIFEHVYDLLYQTWILRSSDLSLKNKCWISTLCETNTAHNWAALKRSWIFTEILIISEEQI